MKLQQTDEWFEQRVGKVTASRVSDVLATTRSGGESASRATYRTELVVERLTGRKTQIPTTSSMQWGIDCEPLARSAYEAEMSCMVTTTGFVDHPKIAMSGASPDGLVGEGLCEIKCPDSKAHIQTLISETIPSGYLLQMQWQMACTGRKWCDFISFDPRLPMDLQLFIRRVDRNDEQIEGMEYAVEAFLKEVDLLIEKLKTLKKEK